MNYSEMSDVEINISVARLLFPNKKVIASASRPPKAHIVGDGLKSGLWVDYCNSWADAGSIIEKNRIHINPMWVSDWCATTECDSFRQINKNPLRAAMITFLMMQEKANA